MQLIERALTHQASEKECAMSEEQTTQQAPKEQPPEDFEATAETKRAEASAIMDELTALGQRVTVAIERVWTSDEFQQAEQEIRKALRMAGDRIDHVAEDLRASEKTQELKDQASKMVDSVEKSEVTQEVRKGLLLGLRKMNDELTRWLEKESAGLEPEPAPTADEPTAEPEPASGEEA
jgi:hypothetical protein